MMKMIYLFLFIGSVGCQEKPAVLMNSNASNKTNVDTKQDSEEIKSTLRKIDYDTSTWYEIVESKFISLDIRYATSNNFTKEVIYPCGRCFIRKSAAPSFHQIASSLIKKGYGLKLFDCYRPHPAQIKLWEIVPNPMYVADPAKGSMHNRGLALDLTLTDLDGDELDMGTEFDFFGKKAYHDFLELPEEILERRTALKETMAEFAWKHTRTEWWHYSYTKASGAIDNFEWPCDE